MVKLRLKRCGKKQHPILASLKFISKISWNW
nr:ribosomal protein S16 [Fagus japonica var. multinervis]